MAIWLHEILNAVLGFIRQQSATVLCVGALVLFGWPFLAWASRRVNRIMSRRYAPQTGMLVGKAVYYGGTALLLVTILNQLGFSLAPLLGAAGVMGVALGFASQTSVANVISGLFLIAEQPFAVGDIITVGDITGEVLSIDLLSVKIRQFDNRYVRIPNESIIKAPMINATRFPVRRLELLVSVAYREDVARVRTILLEIARQHPLCLDAPAPLVIFKGFGDSAIELKLLCWAARADFIALQNVMLEEIKRRFDAEGIEIPFPQRVIRMMSAPEKN